jgi:hypothetical protein
MKEKAIRFKKVASYRTNQILRYLKLLGNCSNKNNYEYSQNEISKIFSAIDKEFKSTKNKFEEKKKSKFEL